MIALASAVGIGLLAFVGVALGIGGGVDAAGDEAFRISGTTLTAYLGSDTYVNIPDTVTVIGDEAFAGNETLTSLTIPDSVTAISYNAFKDCTALESVIIPDSVEKVGPGAFEGCTALSSVEIGSGVSSWGTGVFIGCDSLSRVDIDDDNLWLTYYNGAIYNGNMTMLYQVLPARKGENYVCPDNVEEIDAYAFYGLVNTVNVMISENVDIIPKYAMTYMGTVENVVIKSGTTKIEESAFANSESLAQVAIPESVTEIADNAFANCPNLKIYTTKGSDAATYGKENDIEVIYTAEYPTDFLDSNEDMEEFPDLEGTASTVTTTTVTDTDVTKDSVSGENVSGENVSEEISTEEISTENVSDEEQSGDSDSRFENAQDYVHPLDAPEPDDVVGKTVIVAGQAVVLMDNGDGTVYGEIETETEETETIEEETTEEETTEEETTED